MASADAFLRTTGRFTANRIPVQLAGWHHLLFRTTAAFVVAGNEELALATYVQQAPGSGAVLSFLGSH